MRLTYLSSSPAWSGWTTGPRPEAKGGYRRERTTLIETLLAAGANHMLCSTRPSLGDVGPGAVCRLGVRPRPGSSPCARLLKLPRLMCRSTPRMSNVSLISSCIFCFRAALSLAHPAQLDYAIAPEPPRSLQLAAFLGPPCRNRSFGCHRRRSPIGAPAPEGAAASTSGIRRPPCRNSPRCASKATCGPALVAGRRLKCFRRAEQASTLDQALQPSHALLHMADAPI